MLKRLKKFYKYNRIYSILMLVSLFCFLLMGIGIVVYFVNQTNTSKYGDRCDEVKDYDVPALVQKLENDFKNEKISNITVRDQCATIYITINIDSTTSNEEIKNICATGIANMSEEENKLFELQFIVNREEYPSYMGSKAKNKGSISWGNYSFETTTTTTTTTTTAKKK